MQINFDTLIHTHQNQTKLSFHAAYNPTNDQKYHGSLVNEKCFSG